eukprot:TRINITY_DN10843_c0_g1_i1.p1 TRINITY_DN10843_c0_g1~~TRINITY_DN10843_c0_g1_i1.p1  ORF type:complete len:283 (-),score=37.73 TRINITY_DN10843_c0_g1_i1:2-850(-)
MMYRYLLSSRAPALPRNTALSRPLASTSLPKNTFKQALQERRTQIGLWSSAHSAVVTDVLADSGYDWLVLDMEHAPGEIPGIYSQLQVLARSSTTPVVRPPWNDLVIIKRVLDCGAQTLLIPYVQSAEEARYAVAAARYPPQGIRGAAPVQRASKYGRIQDYLKVANREVCVLVQVETQRAVQQLPEIASVEGVDGIFVGPTDLSIDMGHPHNPGHPAVQEKIAHIASECQRLGKPTGILAPAEQDAKRYIAMGFTFVAVGGDMALFAATADALRRKFKPDF